MNLSTIIIGIILLGGMFSGLSYTITQLSGPAGYGITIDTSQAATFDHTAEIGLQINETYTSIQNLKADRGLNIYIFSFIIDVSLLFKDLLVLPFVILADLLSATTTLLNLPPWSVTLLFTLIIAILVFTFFKMVLGRET